ncbi:MAG: hypothetical protein ACE5ID_11540, partial [Acidobacteriota bacterium]
MRGAVLLSGLLMVLPSAARAAGAAAPRLELTGNLTLEEARPDGYLIRWRPPSHPLLVLEEAGLPRIPVDAGAIPLPEGFTAWVEVVEAPSLVKKGVAGIGSIQPPGEIGSTAEEWGRPGGLRPGLLAEQRLTLAESAGKSWKATAGRVFSGDTRFPGPLLVALPVENIRGRRFLPLRIYPQQWNAKRGSWTSVSSLLLRVHLVEAAAAGGAPTSGSSSSSHLSGKMVQKPGAPAGGAPQAPDLDLVIPTAGFYQLTEADLAAAGVDPATVDATTLKILLDGQEVPVLLAGNGDAVLDPGESLLFYGQQAVSNFTQFPYRYDNVARMSSGGAAGLRIQSRPAAAPGTAATSFLDHVVMESNLILTADSMDADGDYYFWRILGSGPTFADDQFDVTVNTPRAVNIGGQATLTVRLQGRRLTSASGGAVSDGPHHTRILWNGVVKEDVTWNGLNPHTAVISLADSEVLAGSN